MDFEDLRSSKSWRFFDEKGDQTTHFHRGHVKF